MKTLADVKRKMKVGLVFRCEHHPRPEISGPREVVKVQQNAIAYLFEKPGMTERQKGWIYWGKASQVKVHGESITFLDEQGNQHFTYHFEN